MEGRDGHAILLNVDAVLEGVGSANLAGGVLGSHCGVLSGGVEVSCQLLCPRVGFVDGGGRGGAGRSGGALVISHTDERQRPGRTCRPGRRGRRKEQARGSSTFLAQSEPRRKRKAAHADN